MAETLVYPFVERPPAGTMLAVAPGVFWVRMPIPIPGLNFINLWVLEDQGGFTVIDTGLATKDVKAHWERIFAEQFGGQPVTRVICTHFHPDHIGEAGWITGRFGVELWMTLGEWSFGRMLSLDSEPTVPDDVMAFYRRMGFSDAALERYQARGADGFSRGVTKVPRALRRIVGGDRIRIGGRDWQVIIGQGHSPEHAALYCAELGLLISGDQVLPRISPHVGVYPTEPDGNPLQLYLDSLASFRPLPQDTLVLPSHNEPFRGLHRRLDMLAEHHDTRLEDLYQACVEPQSALDVLPVLFHRPLDERSTFMAASESVAHLHCLLAQGRLSRRLGTDGIYRYRQHAEAAASAA